MSRPVRIFLDTNVLIYQFDKSEPTKQKRAQEVVDQCINNDEPTLSTQVIQEFINVSLKKFANSLSIDDLTILIDTVLQPMCRQAPDFLFYMRALELYRLNSLSFYDALIIQAALDTGCETLYSEDLQDGQIFGKLTVKNPFKSC